MKNQPLIQQKGTVMSNRDTPSCSSGHDSAFPVYQRQGEIKWKCSYCEEEFFEKDEQSMQDTDRFKSHVKPKDRFFDSLHHES